YVFYAFDIYEIVERENQYPEAFRPYMIGHVPDNDISFWNVKAFVNVLGSPFLKIFNIEPVAQNHQFVVVFRVHDFFESFTNGFGDAGYFVNSAVIVLDFREKTRTAAHVFFRKHRLAFQPEENVGEHVSQYEFPVMDVNQV